MTRRELLERMIRKAGTAVTVGGKEGYAVVCPSGTRTPEGARRYFYLAGEGMLPNTGEILCLNGQAYTVIRSGLEAASGGARYAWAYLELERGV